MNILVISPFVPFPLDSGGKIRVFNLVRRLARGNTVTLACLSDSANPSLGPLADFCREVRAVHRTPQPLRELAAFLCTPTAYNVTRFSSPELRRALAELRQRGSFDLVLLEFSFMWGYADIFAGMPVVLDAHNIEADIVAQIGAAHPSSLRRLAYRLETSRMARLEEQAWHEAALILAVSEEEGRRIAAATGEAGKVVIAPNGVDLERFTCVPTEERRDNVLFLGGMDYAPNRDAAGWLLQDIHPLIRRLRPDVRMDMVGRGLEQLAPAPPEGVVWHDGAADVLPWFRSSGVLVVPLRQGAGTRLKVLEAMASGLPVVSTSKGCEGVGVRDGEHLLVADTPEEMAAAVARLLQDEGERRELALAARQLVEERYGWERIVAGVERELGKTVNGQW